MNVAIVPFNVAVEDVSRGNPKLPQSSFLAAGAFPVVDQGQRRVAGYADDEALLCQVPGPLIVFGDHTRAFKYVNFPFVIGADGVKVLRVREGWDPKYVYHYLSSRDIPSAGYSRHFKFLKELEVPQPPLDEQRRVAAILDQAEALRGKRHRTLAHLEVLTRSVFRDAFMDVAEASRLSDLATTTSGGTPNRLIPSNYGGGIPWVKSGELHAGLVTATEETISAKGLSSSSAKVFPAGTVLLAMYGATAGVVGQLGVDAATNQAICAITPGPSLDAKYLIAALRAQTVQLVAKAAGGAQPNLSQGIIRDIVIPVPSLDDQQRFSRQVAAIDAQRFSVVRAQAMDDHLFASVQARAFRGEL